MRGVSRSFCAALLVTLAASGSAQAATVPDHEPMRVVIVSDEVNPHDLSDAQLTQPGEIGPALMAGDSGLNIASLDEIDSGCVDDAVAALNGGEVDVLIYFAHRSANACSGADAQDAFTDSVREHLRRGGGVVVFHHGIFTANGKQELLGLLGGSAGQIAWEPAAGQNVIAVAPEHFVASNGLALTQTLPFGSGPLGVPDGDYPFFNNAPDERYPNTQIHTDAGEERTILFASDFSGAQVLGYDLRRPDWSGHVLYYQPGEYQPNALDDRSGPNFQILANAIYYAATTQDEIDPPTTTTGPSGSDSSGGEGDGSSTGGLSAGTAGTTNDSASTDPPRDDDDGGSSGGVGGDGDGSSGGCACDVGAVPTSVPWWALALPWIVRRRRSRR